VGRVSANQALASAVVERLREAGVRTFCVCPGGRNAPLIEVLDALPRGAAEVLGFFDERSAGFFAFGRARRERRPVAVVTTSGTAAAELLPAMVEAYYSSAPIVAVTADRPRAYRRSGSPQTIEQAGLFGVYATPSLDLEGPDELPELPALAGPAHVNVCFAEPLLAGWQVDDGPAGEEVRGAAGRRAGLELTVSGDNVWDEPRAFLSEAARPLVIVGGLQDEGDRLAALGLCQRLQAPVVAEASSGIRSALGSLLLRAGDASVQRGVETQAFDSVIRIGDVPSFRVWRDLDLALTQPVLSISRKPWRGLTRGLHVQVRSGECLLPAGIASALEGRSGGGESCAVTRQLSEWDGRLSAATNQLLAAHPQSEPALVRRLSETIPAGSFVYLGNSLPIREWNQFATFEDRGFTFGENRGANGIDGQVASFLGWARPGVENWAVVGDLTALFDLSSLWALRHLDGIRVRVVVINNGGGRIFKGMFRNERFQNRHAIGFDAWAAMWGAEHRADLNARSLGPAAVIEVRPDEAQTDAFWAALADETRR
jgi:2-succinyl-5-enolpyruvyl-6-hydroxy-3-cyclohexene-1-carboxylate synthase